MTNVLCIEPNLGMYKEGGELKFFNLVWGGWQAADPGYDFFSNFLLRRGTDGSIIPPSFPTDIEMQTQIQSLVYDGVYFWSVQAINDTPNYPGWVLNKWEISDELYALSRVSFKLFPGFYSATAMALEWYEFPLYGSVGAGENKIKINTDRSFILDRLRVGQKLRLGPNTLDQYFWGTIKDIYPWPNDPFVVHNWYYIEFEESLPTSFVADGPVGVDPTPNSCFIEARVWVFDSGGYLYEIDPVDMSVVNKTYSSMFRGVSAADFSVVKNIPSINALQLTQGLFFVRDMVLYCADITEDFESRYEEVGIEYYLLQNPDGSYTVQTRPRYEMTNNIVAAQSLYLNYYDGGNDFIPVYELRIRNDDPEAPYGLNHPQYYRLQRDYRETRHSDVETFADGTYNYITQESGELPKMEAQPTFLLLNVDPQRLEENALAYCSCQVLDDYRFPVPNIEITWSGTEDIGYYLNPVVAYTNSSGIAYNIFFTASETMPFPAYLYVSSSDLE